MEFTSSEQAFQFAKADFHNKRSKAKRILHLDDPFAIKKVGDSIINSPEWLERRDEILEEIMREKFLQNADAGLRLEQTGSKTIHEATTGPHWGINAGLRSKLTRTVTGNGENVTGEILMRIRSELQQEKGVGTGGTGTGDCGVGTENDPSGHQESTQTEDQ